MPRRPGGANRGGEVAPLPSPQADSQQRDDYQLMAAIAQRDAAALEQLYDRHSGIVYALGFRVMGDWFEAEALVVDVFWELWSRPDRYDAARGSPQAFIITLARSRAIDRRRSTKKGAFAAEVPMPEDGAPGAAAANDATGAPAPGEAGPLEQAIATEQHHRIAELLDQLPPEQRQAIELAYFEGLSHSEIATRLDESLGTVKSRIRRGLIRLRDLLRSSYQDGTLP